MLLLLLTYLLDAAMKFWNFFRAVTLVIIANGHAIVTFFYNISYNILEFNWEYAAGNYLVGYKCKIDIIRNVKKRLL